MTTRNDKTNALLKAMQKKPPVEIVQALDISDFPELGKGAVPKGKKNNVKR